MLPIGYTIHQKYRITRQIAAGGGGNVYEVVDVATSNFFAIKECFLAEVTKHDEMKRVVVGVPSAKTLFEQHVANFLEEGKMLKALDNRYVVKVYDVFLENGTAYYVMDLVIGTTLSNIVANTRIGLQINTALNLFNQLLKAAEDIHAHGFLHLDIKPANIIVDNLGNLKLIDFGSARDMKNVGKINPHFTPAYAPMELQYMMTEQIGVWTDMYAIGATLYFMICAIAPPSCSDILEKGKDAFRFNERIPDRLKEMIVWMMTPNKDIRPQNYHQVVYFFNHGNAPASNAQTIEETDNKERKQEDEGSFVSISNQNASPQPPHIPTVNPAMQGNVTPRTVKPIPKEMSNNLPRKSNKLGLAILLAVVITAILLYKAFEVKLLPLRCSGADETENVQDVVVEDNEEDVRMSEEKRLFDNLMNVCDKAKDKLKMAKKKDDVALIVKHFDNQCNNIINRSNVDLNGNYYEQYRRKVNEVVKMAENKKKEIVRKEEEEKRKREEERRREQELEEFDQDNVILFGEEINVEPPFDNFDVDENAYDN